MADHISKLPKTYEIPSEQDMRVLHSLFGSNSGSGWERSGLIVPGILFFLLSLPFFDNIIKNVVTASDTIILLIKTGLFLLLLLIAQIFGIA